MTPAAAVTAKERPRFLGVTGQGLAIAIADRRHTWRAARVQRSNRRGKWPANVANAQDHSREDVKGVGATFVVVVAVVVIVVVVIIVSVVVGCQSSCRGCFCHYCIRDGRIATVRIPNTICLSVRRLRRDLRRIGSNGDLCDFAQG